MAKPASDGSSPNRNWDKPSPSVPSPSMATSTLIERLLASATSESILTIVIKLRITPLQIRDFERS